MTLRETRAQYGVSAKELSENINIPLRTYVRYENDEDYGDSLKRKQILELIRKKYEITEDKGMLTLNYIIKTINEIMEDYGNTVAFCYLFGSYAKGYANEKSDIDLCISTTLTGLSYIGLLEDLRTSLKKRIDLIRITDLSGNIELITEIMKDGIKIFG